MEDNNKLFSYFNILLKIIDMRNSTNILEKQLESRHTMVSSKQPIPKLIKSDKIRLEGYLFKRTSNAFKTWNRRWFIIQDHQLVYQKRSHDKELTIMEEDLRLCTAKHVQFMERRFCFEVLSPSKSHILQADSEEACQQWISAMQAGIDAAYNNNDNHNDGQSLDSQDSWCTASSNSSASKQSSHSISNLSTAAAGVVIGVAANPQLVNPPAKPPRMSYTQILVIPGNELCCDCGAADPKWASINIGITLCIECSGIHRSLGVHLSKVRSLNLDAWDVELIKVMSTLGNTLINSIYEAKVDETVAQRAKPDSSRGQRELWIKAKYVKKAFVDKSDAQLMLSKASEETKTEALTDSSATDSDKCDNELKVSSSGCNNQPTNDTNNSCCHNSTDSSSSSDGTNKVVDECPTSSSTVEPVPKTVDNESDSEDEDSEETQLIINSCDNTSKENNNINNKSDHKVVGNNSCDIKVVKIDENKEIVVSQPTNSDVKDVNSVVLSSSSQMIDNTYYNQMLYNSAINCDLKTMSTALAKGAVINWPNTDDQNRTPLHQAIMSDAVTVCEYLLLNGAKSNVTDNNGTTPLHLATERGNTGQVCLLLKRGADQSCTDKNGNNALMIAINNANADIVTLLRLAKLNDEMKNDEEFGNISDETFNEVVRDFSQLASQSPEKLRRNNNHNNNNNNNNNSESDIKIKSQNTTVS